MKELRDAITLTILGIVILSWSSIMVIKDAMIHSFDAFALAGIVLGTLAIWKAEQCYRDYKVQITGELPQEGRLKRRATLACLVIGLVLLAIFIGLFGSHESQLIGVRA